MKKQLSSQDDVDFELVLIAPEINNCDEILESEKYFAIVINKELGVFQLENIPFYNRHVAFRDIIQAEYDPKIECFKYVETIEKSGEITIALRILDLKFDIKAHLIEYDIQFRMEQISDNKFSISISPNDIDHYIKVYRVIKTIEESNKIEVYK
jgi:hypothetical protein